MALANYTDFYKRARIYARGSSTADPPAQATLDDFYVLAEQRLKIEYPRIAPDPITLTGQDLDNYISAAAALVAMQWRESDEGRAVTARTDTTVEVGHVTRKTTVSATGIDLDAEYKRFMTAVLAPTTTKRRSRVKLFDTMPTDGYGRAIPPRRRSWG